MKTSLSLICGTVALLSLAACKQVDPKAVAAHYQAYSGSYELAEAEQGHYPIVACPIQMKIQISESAAILEELMDSPLEKGVQQTRFDEEFFKGKSTSKESCPGGGYRISDCEPTRSETSQSVKVISENELVISNSSEGTVSNSWSHRGGSVSYSSLLTKAITLGNDGSVRIKKTHRAYRSDQANQISSASTCLYKKQN